MLEVAKQAEELAVAAATEAAQDEADAKHAEQIAELEAKHEE
jgi:hypothetical protein